MIWDFFTLRPESTYQLLIHYSDRGTPDGFRHMHGYGSNTYKLVNAEGIPVYCKFHYRVFSFTFIKTKILLKISMYIF